MLSVLKPSTDTQLDCGCPALKGSSSKPIISKKNRPIHQNIGRIKTTAGGEMAGGGFPIAKVRF